MQIDVLGPLKSVFEWLMEQILSGINTLFNLLIGLVVELVREFLTISLDPISDLQPIWEISVTIYVALLSLVGVSVLGMIQLFPESEKIDPHRFAGRGFAATLSLIAVNPPGDSNLFSKGIIAWAVTVVVAIQDALLDTASCIGGSADCLGTASLSAAGGGIASIIVVIVVGLFASVSLTVVMLGFLALLVVREILVYVAFALYPLLIAMWVVDVGPMKYGKQLSAMVFKAAGLMLVAGVVVAGMMAVSVQLVGTGGGGGTAAAATAADASTVAAGGAEGGQLAAAPDLGSVVGDVLRKTVSGLAIAFGGALIMSMAAMYSGIGGVGSAIKKSVGGIVSKGKSTFGRGSGSKSSGSTSGGSPAEPAGGTASTGTGSGSAPGGGPAPGQSGTDSRQLPDTASPSQLDNPGIDEYGQDLSTTPGTTGPTVPPPDGDSDPLAASADSTATVQDSQDIDLSEVDSSDDFEDALSEDWSDEQVEDLQQIYEQAGGNTGNKYLESAASDAVKGAITGAVSGAAAGTVAGPVGTVVGAGVGAVGGAVSGAAKGVAGSGAASFTQKLRETDSLREASQATVDSFTSEMRTEWYDLDFSLGGSSEAESSDGDNEASKYR